MNDYMQVQMGIPADQIPIIRRVYFNTYGTTLRGLQIHYQIDPDDFLAYVHDLPIEEVLTADQELHDMLSGMPQQKWIFTNANAEHADRVLKALKIRDCFNGIIDIRALGFVCKPALKAYQIALRIAGVDSPDKCVYLDDALRNLVPAQDLGFYTVLVSSDGAQSTANLTIARPHELLGSMPELWQDK
jgi:pyrimidine 5'-nucleotidase